MRAENFSPALAYLHMSQLCSCASACGQHAATHGHLNAVAVLIDGGAKSELQDKESGYTALHRAFLCCKLETAASLVRSGASLHSPCDLEGLTPLQLFCRKYAGKVETQSFSGECYTWGDVAAVGLGRVEGDCDHNSDLHCKNED